MEDTPSKYYETCPYPAPKIPHSAIVWRVDAPMIRTIANLSLPAIRIIFLLANSINNEGYVPLSTKELAKMGRVSVSLTNKGIRCLVALDLIQRRDLTSFWVSPKVAERVTLM